MAPTPPTPPTPKPGNLLALLSGRSSEMDAPGLVATLRSRGIPLAVSDGNLIVDHHGELTDADRDLIRTHKPALLALLAREDFATLDPAVAGPPPPHDRPRDGD